MSWLVIIALGALVWGAVSIPTALLLGAVIKRRDRMESPLLPSGGVRCSNF